MKNLILFISIGLSTFAFADKNPCMDNLFNAGKLYEKGQFQEAVNTLQPCVESNNFNKDQKFDATRLLALCYVYLNDAKQAEAYIEKMLKIRPDYQKYPYIDPGEFRSVINKFVVKSVLDIGFETGISNNWVRVIRNYSAANTPSTYESRGGFKAGVLAEYHVNKSLSLLMQPNYNTINYQRQMENVAGSRKEYSELMIGIEIPVSGRMYFGKGNWKFYTQAGFQWNRLVKSFADVNSTNLLDGSVFQSSTETTPYRKRSLYGFNAGLGASANLGRGIATFGCSFRYFIPNIAIPEKRYDNTDFILNSQYIDSDFSVNSLIFNISYQLPFRYSVKKNRS